MVQHREPLCRFPESPARFHDRVLPTGALTSPRSISRMNVIGPQIGNDAADNYQIFIDGWRGDIAHPVRRRGSGIPIAPCRTLPPSPKPEIGCPVLASRHQRSPSRVPENTRRSSPFFHTASPRWAQRFFRCIRSIFGSNDHNSLPVSGSRATTLQNGVVMYMTPSRTIGVHSNADLVG